MLTGHCLLKCQLKKTGKIHRDFAKLRTEIAGDFPKELCSFDIVSLHVLKINWAKFEMISFALSKQKHELLLVR